MTSLHERLDALVRNQIAPRLSPAVADRIDRLSATLTLQGRVVRLRRRLRALADGSAPIVVGPWITEVGFELLYWIPFLSWAATTFDLPRERLVIVSRGGTARWYAHLSDTYVDILDHMSPDEFRAGNEARVQAQRNRLKHVSVSALDDQLVTRVKRSLGVTDVQLLHPSLMYDLFTPFFRRRAPLRFVRRHTRFQRFESPADAAVSSRLPEQYVAVKFYFSDTFPDIDDNREFISTLVAQLSEHLPVVLLNTGLMLDDHHESRATRADRVQTIDTWITPANNLDVQTQIISRAKAFFGTYGGLAYLPPLYGVSSVGFYSDLTTMLPHHLDLAQRVFGEIGGGHLAALHVHDLNLLRSMRLTDEPLRMQVRGG